MREHRRRQTDHGLGIVEANGGRGVGDNEVRARPREELDMGPGEE